VENRLGVVRISPNVLATIARLTALSVPGVARMFHELPKGMERLLKGKGASDGVHVQMVDDAVVVDLCVVAAQNVNLYELGRELQSAVSRAVRDMVGMPVLAVNVHVADVEIAPPQ